MNKCIRCGGNETSNTDKIPCIDCCCEWLRMVWPIYISTGSEELKDKIWQMFIKKEI
jgi:hypothetical protein